MSPELAFGNIYAQDATCRPENLKSELWRESDENADRESKLVCSCSLPDGPIITTVRFSSSLGTLGLI
jgi:hypothetical protein